MEYCKTTGKQMFATRGDAEMSLKSLKKRKGYSGGAVYFCPGCNSYHMTHFSYAKSKSIRSRRKKYKQDYDGYE